MSDAVEPKFIIKRADLTTAGSPLDLGVESLDVDTPRPKTPVNRVASYSSQPVNRVTETTSPRHHSNISGENFDRVPSQSEVNEMLAAGTVFRQAPAAAQKKIEPAVYQQLEELTPVEESSGFWGGVKSFFKGAKKITKDIANVVVNTDWEKVGSKVLELGEKALDYSIKALQDPATYIAVGTALVHGAAYLGKGTLNAILHPVGTAMRAYGVIKSISDSIGFSDVLIGIRSLGVGVFQYGYDLLRPGGGFDVANENGLKNLQKVGKGFVGAAQCFAEVTGLADLCQAGKYGVQAIVLYGQGRKLEAAFALGNCAMHAVFAVASAQSISATIATGGAAIGSVAAVAGLKVFAKEAMKQTLKVAAKEGLEGIGKELAKTAMKEIGAEALEKSAAKMLSTALTETTQRLVSEVTEHGAGKLVADNVKRIASETAEKQSVKFFTDSGLEKIITEGGFRILKSLREGANSKNIVTLLKTAGGLSDEGAEVALKEIRVAIARGKNDAEIIEALTEGASKPISNMLKNSTADSFEAGLKKSLHSERKLADALADNARKASKSTDELATELSRAGREGYEEGIEKGIKTACREAFKKSMRRLRAHGDGSASGGAGGASNEELEGEYQKLQFDPLTSGDPEARKGAEGELRLLEVFETIEPDDKGRPFKVKGAYYKSGNRTVRIIRDRLPVDPE
jgi:hypothetical protein